MRAYEDSLQRLGMNRIDILIIHDLDFWHHQTEAKVSAYLAQLATGGFRALEELKQHGLIRAIGAGINELGMMPALSRSGRPRLLHARPALHTWRA